jgi:hypothetical protein
MVAIHKSSYKVLKLIRRVGGAPNPQTLIAMFCVGTLIYSTRYFRVAMFGQQLSGWSKPTSYYRADPLFYQIGVLYPGGYLPIQVF